jgi:hypothetical protein
MTNAPGCSRSWQAEAAEDRRLSDADRASFERHLATCSDCARAVRELAKLRSLGPRTEAAKSPPLEHRRAKNELLRKANELTVGAPRATRWRGIALAAAALLLAASVVVGLRMRPRAPDRAAAPSEPSYELVTSAGAEWTPLERGATLKLAVRRGRFELSVRHLSSGQRFLLVLPDGELEVRGTRFVVEVDGVRTLSVSVAEGRVALRVGERSGPPLLLGAGERFAGAPAPPPPASASAPLPEPAPPLAPARSEPEPAPSGVASPAPSDHAAAPGAAGGTAAERSAGAEFTRAMSAFSSGNYGEAETSFRAFAARHPADPRAEDATFLSAVASARRGDQQGARALAKRYLARYPNGLRRREAERLAE